MAETESTQIQTWEFGLRNQFKSMNIKIFTLPRQLYIIENGSCHISWLIKPAVILQLLCSRLDGIYSLIESPTQCFKNMHSRKITSICQKVYVLCKSLVCVTCKWMEDPYLLWERKIVISLILSIEVLLNLQPPLRLESWLFSKVVIKGYGLWFPVGLLHSMTAPWHLGLRLLSEHSST